MTNEELDEFVGSKRLPPLSADRLTRIEALVAADLKPVRPLAPAGVYLAAFAAIVIAGCLASWLYFSGQSGWEALSNLQKLLVFVPLCAIAALLIFSGVRQMTPAARYTRTTALCGGGVFLLLLGLMALILQPVHESAFVRAGLICLRNGMTFAIPVAFLFALVLLRGALLSPALAGATAGGLAGLVGMAVLEIHCPNLNLYHILVWHVSVVLICVIAGAVFSSVTFRRRISNH
jgi:hypothetical protein